MDPVIAEELAMAFLRLGHSLRGNEVESLDSSRRYVDDANALSQACFKPSVVEADRDGQEFDNPR